MTIRASERSNLAVITTLLGPLRWRKGHIIVMDRAYNSLAVLAELRHTYGTYGVGTVMVARIKGAFAACSIKKRS